MKTKKTSFLARAAMTLLLAVLTTATAWADSWPEYITDVILVGGSSDEVTTAKSANSGYSWCSMDLNDGASGDYIYLGYKTGYRANVNGGYITDIIVIDAEGTNPPSTVTYSGRTYYLCPYDGGSHFEDVKGNLNSNCGGGWNLYLYYTKANIGKQAVSSITVNSTKDGAINCYYTNGNSHETQIDLNRGLSGSSDVYMHLTTATKTNRPSTDPVMASGLTYNGGEQQLIATAATLASGTMYYRIGTSGSFTSNVADVKATAAGSYTVYYYADSNSYSDASSTHSASVTIGKSANSGVTVSCADIVEGNALNPQLGGTNLSTGAVTYKYCTTQNGTYTATAPTTAGTYYVKATVAADGNCNEFTTAYATFTIRRDWALHNTGDSEADAYVITTTGDLDLLAQRVNAGNAYSGKYFRLGGNITYSHDSEWNNTTSTENNYTPIGKSGATFKGHFDGKGFTVSGIRISSSSDYNGLFGYLYDGATVKNVILSDARIMSGSYSGGIAGDCNISTITNCWVKSNVCIGRYSYVGGIAGNLYGGAIIGCRSEATLIAASGSGRQRYGGIAGSLNVSAANVKHCIVAGATVPGTAYRGAVVGRLWLGSLTNNYYINCSVAGVADATNVGCTDDTNLADTNGARHAVTIGAATGVTITPVGTETNYNLSGITAYEGNNGIIYGGQLYAGAGETVRLNIAYTVPDGCTLNGFTDGNGNALADNGDGSYTLTMTGAAATVTPDVYDLWGIADGRDGSTAAKAYRITTPDGLDLLATRVNGGTTYENTYFELGADITYDYTGLAETGSNYTAIGTYQKGFNGHFDGKGHTVSGIRIYRSGTADPDKYQGLFGQINNGEVKNVSLSDACITGDDHTGGIVGWNNYGTIENCHVLSTVTVLGTKDKAHEHGGIVGYNIGGSIIGCTSSADVTAEMSGTYYGGIAGWNYEGTIRDCLVYGGSVSGSSSVGAITGSNDGGGTLTNNYHTIYGMGGVNGSDQDGARYAVATGSKPDGFGDATATYGTGAYTGITAYGTNGLEYGGKYYRYDATTMLVFEDHGTENDELIVANNGQTCNAILNGRTLYKDGKWNTIRLPFDVDMTDPAGPLYGATYRTVTDASISGTTLNITFAERWNESWPDNTLIAGCPYIIKWDKASDYVDDDAHNIVNPVFVGVEIQNVGGGYWGGSVSFDGTYDARPDITTYNSGYDVLLMGGNNTLRYAGSGASLGAFRAFFLVDPTKVGNGNQANARLTSFNIDFGDGDDNTTGIIEVNATAFRTHGSDAWYTLDGRRLQGKPAQSGIYINNGKKVAIK